MNYSLFIILNFDKENFIHHSSKSDSIHHRIRKKSDIYICIYITYIFMINHQGQSNNPKSENNNV